MKEKLSLNTKYIILCAMFAALSAIGAFIKIPLPVIPFTLQLPIVALGAVLLGSKYSALSQLAYLLVGLVGFPVFTKGGGLNYIFEPTFGFLIGYVVCSYVIGKYLEKTNRYNVLNILIACVIGILVDYVCGVVYMYFILNFYLHTTTTIWAVCWSGAIIFLPKDLLLCLLTSLISSRLLPALKKARLI